jgi:hypothetical protein
MLSDDVEFAGDPLARDRVVDNGGKALACEVVDDAQDPEAAAIGQRVGDEVEAPALIGAPCGIAIGALVPSARLRPPRLRTVSRSSR